MMSVDHEIKELRVLVERKCSPHRRRVVEPGGVVTKTISGTKNPGSVSTKTTYGGIGLRHQPTGSSLVDSRRASWVLEQKDRDSDHTKSMTPRIGREPKALRGQEVVRGSQWSPERRRSAEQGSTRKNQRKRKSQKVSPSVALSSDSTTESVDEDSELVAASDASDTGRVTRSKGVVDVATKANEVTGTGVTFEGTMTTGVNGTVGSSPDKPAEVMKRGRGRPRKYPLGQEPYLLKKLQRLKQRSYIRSKKRHSLSTRGRSLLEACQTSESSESEIERKTRARKRGRANYASLVSSSELAVSNTQDDDYVPQTKRSRPSPSKSLSAHTETESSVVRGTDLASILSDIPDVSIIPMASVTVDVETTSMGHRVSMAPQSEHPNQRNSDPLDSHMKPPVSSSSSLPEPLPNSSIVKRLNLRNTADRRSRANTSMNATPTATPIHSPIPAKHDSSSLKSSDESKLGQNTSSVEAKDGGKSGGSDSRTKAVDEKTRGLSSHSRFLMSLKADCGRGSNSTRGCMLYVFEHCPDMLKGNEPWINKARVIWNTWRSKVPEDIRKKYIERAKQNKKKFLSEGGSVPSPRQVANQRRDTARKLSAFTPMTSRLKERSPLQFEDSSHAAASGVTPNVRRSSYAESQEQSKAEKSAMDSQGRSRSKSLSSYSTSEILAALPLSSLSTMSQGNYVYTSATVDKFGQATMRPHNTARNDGRAVQGKEVLSNGLAPADAGGSSSNGIPQSQTVHTQLESGLLAVENAVHNKGSYTRLVDSRANGNKTPQNRSTSGKHENSPRTETPQERNVNQLNSTHLSTRRPSNNADNALRKDQSEMNQSRSIYNSDSSVRRECLPPNSGIINFYQDQAMAPVVENSVPTPFKACPASILLSHTSHVNKQNDSRKVAAPAIRGTAAPIMNGSDISVSHTDAPNASEHDGKKLVQMENMLGTSKQEADGPVVQEPGRPTVTEYVSGLGQDGDLADWPGAGGHGARLSPKKKHSQREVPCFPSSSGILQQGQALIRDQSHHQHRDSVPTQRSSTQEMRNGLEGKTTLNQSLNTSKQRCENSNGEMSHLSRKSASLGQQHETSVVQSDVLTQKRGLLKKPNVAGQIVISNKKASTSRKASNVSKSNSSRQAAQFPNKSRHPEQGSMIPISSIAQTVAELPRGLNTSRLVNNLSSIPDISVLKERLSGNSNIMEQLADLHEQLRASCQSSGISGWDKEEDVPCRPDISGQREKIGQKSVASDQVPELSGKSVSSQIETPSVSRSSLMVKGPDINGVSNVAGTDKVSKSSGLVNPSTRSTDTSKEMCQSFCSAYGSHLPLQVREAPSSTPSFISRGSIPSVSSSSESQDMLLKSHDSNGEVSEIYPKGATDATAAGFTMNLWQNDTSSVAELSSNYGKSLANMSSAVSTVEVKTVFANSLTCFSNCEGAVVSITKLQNHVAEEARDDNECSESGLSNVSSNQSSNFSSPSGHKPYEVMIDTPDGSGNSDKFSVVFRLQESPLVNVASSPVQAHLVHPEVSSLNEYCVGVEKLVNPVLPSPREISALRTSSDLLSGINPISPISRKKSFASLSLPPSSQVSKIPPVSSTSSTSIGLSVTVETSTTTMSFQRSAMDCVTSNSSPHCAKDQQKELPRPNLPQSLTLSTECNKQERQYLLPSNTTVSSFSNTSTTLQSSIRLQPPLSNSLPQPEEALTSSKNFKNRGNNQVTAASERAKKRQKKKQVKKTMITSGDRTKSLTTSVLTTSASGYSITTQQYSSARSSSIWQNDLATPSSTTSLPACSYSYSSYSHQSVDRYHQHDAPSLHSRAPGSLAEKQNPAVSPIQNPAVSPRQPVNASSFAQPRAPCMSSPSSSLDIHFPSSLRETCRAIHKVSSCNNPIRMYDDDQPPNGGIEKASYTVESPFGESQGSSGHMRHLNQSVSVVSPLQSANSSYSSRPPSRPSSISSGRDTASPAMSSHVQGCSHQRSQSSVGVDRTHADMLYRRHSSLGFGEADYHNQNGRDERRWFANGHSDGSSQEKEKVGFRPYSRTADRGERRSLSMCSDSVRPAVNGQHPLPDQHYLSRRSSTPEELCTGNSMDRLDNSSLYCNRHDSSGHSSPSSVSTHPSSQQSGSSRHSGNSSSRRKRSHKPLKTGAPLALHNSTLSPLTADSPQIYMGEMEVSSRPARHSHSNPRQQRPLSISSSFTPGEPPRPLSKNQSLTFHQYYQSSSSSSQSMPAGSPHGSRGSPHQRDSNSDQPFRTHEPPNDFTKMSRWELEQLHYYVVTAMKRHRQILQGVEEQLKVLDNRCSGPPPPRLTPRDMQKRFLALAIQPDCGMVDDESYKEKFGYGPGGEKLNDLIIGGTPESPIINPKYDVYGSGNNSQVQSRI